MMIVLKQVALVSKAEEEYRKFTSAKGMMLSVYIVTTVTTAQVNES